MYIVIGMIEIFLKKKKDLVDKMFVRNKYGYD